MSRRLVACLFSVLLIACRTPPAKVDLAAAEVAVRAASANFSAAETSGRHDSAMAFMWDDAVLQPPDTVQISGRDQIRAFYARVKLSPPPPDSTPPPYARTIVMGASGDVAAEWGPGAIVVDLPTGPHLVRFKFMILWERRSGVWKLRFNSWSGDPERRPGTVGDLRRGLDGEGSAVSAELAAGGRVDAG